MYNKDPSINTTDKIHSVKYQLLVCEFSRLISPEQNTASTQTLYQMIHLRRLIPYTKLYAQTLFRRTLDRVEVHCQVFNYRIGNFIIGFHLLAIFNYRRL